MHIYMCVCIHIYIYMHIYIYIYIWIPVQFANPVLSNRFRKKPSSTGEGKLFFI